MTEEQMMFKAMCRYMKQYKVNTINPYNLSVELDRIMEGSYKIPFKYGIKTEGSKNFWRTYYKLEKTGLVETIKGKGVYGITVIQFTEKGINYIKSLRGGK